MTEFATKSGIPRSTCLGLLLFLITFALFAPSISYDLVQVDDPAYITHNTPVLNGLSAQSIRAAFAPDNAVAPMYMPVLWISYMTDVSLFHASPQQPWGFHFTNVLLHAANALLLYLLLLAVCKRPWTAFACAALWAFHPLRVESVAWVTERKDVLSGLFALLCIGFYARAQRRQRGARAGWQAAALGAYIAGLLVKPSIVPLPLALVCLDFWPLRRTAQAGGIFSRGFLRLLYEKIPFLIAAAGVAWAALQGHRTIGALDHAPFWQHAMQVPVNSAFYLFKIVWPTRLGPLYPLVPFTWTRFFIGTSVLVAASGWAWHIRNRRPQVGIGWLWFWAFLLPVIGFFGPLGINGVADRFTYLPSMGLSLALLPLTRPGTTGRRRFHSIARPVAVGFILILLCALTLQLLPIWTTSERLLERVHVLAPDHPATRNVHILRQLQQNGDFPAARTALQEALKTAPNDMDLISSLSLCLHEQEGPDAALNFLEQHPPESAVQGEWEFQMAQFSFLAAKHEKSLEHATRARKRLPASDAIQNNLLLLSMAAAYEKGDAQAALSFAGSLPPFRQHEKIDLPDLMPLHAYHWEMGLRSASLDYFQRLIDTCPDRIDLLNNIAWLLATATWSPAAPQEVLAIAQHAQRLADAPHPVLLDTLAAAQANAGEYESAVHTLRQALELIPASPDTAKLRSSIHSRLELYLNQKPYREEAASRLW